MYKFSTAKDGPETKQHIMKAYVNCTWALVGGKSFGSYHDHVFPPRKSPCLTMDNGMAAKWMLVWCKRKDLCSGQKSVLVSTVDNLCINGALQAHTKHASHISRNVLGTQVAQRSMRYLSTHNQAETSDTLHKITTRPSENV